MSRLVTDTISAFLLPPLNLLLLGGLGIVLLKRRPHLGRGFIIAAWLLLYTLSTPIVAGILTRSLERTPPLQPGEYAHDVDAIVVLSASSYFNAPEYGSDTTKGHALERLRYAARLHRATGLPILACGGSTDGDSVAESVVMKEALVNDFHVPVQWVEDQSRNTLENARFSYALLKPQGKTRIYLVTHALHMPRALAAFEKVGFQVVPAPTMFATYRRLTLLSFLPAAPALATSYGAMHEWIGRLWYLFR
ncbi:MAG: YdcF family protein [Deltaproteobacteria bacterium]|nr:YdcF family protein [Deltaproteobacteria bacterium]